VRWMNAAGAAAAALCLIGATQAAPAPDAVLAELKAGNEHHVSKKYLHPHQTAARQRKRGPPGATGGRPARAP